MADSRNSKRIISGRERRALGLALALAALAALLVASVPASQADEADGLVTLARTRLSPVKLDGATVERQFDEHGRVIASTTTDASVSPPVVETYRVSRDAGIETRETTVVQGKDTLRVIRVKVDAHGTLVERETIWKDEDGEFREMERLVNADRAITLFRRSGEDWKEIARSTESAMHVQGAPAPGATLDRYVECLSHAHSGIDAGACRAYLSNLAAHFPALDAVANARLTNLQCRVDDVLYLPSSYTVDLRSCTRPDAVTAVAAAASSAQASVSCMSQLNPAFARAFLATVQRKMPMLRCAGEGTNVNYAAEFPCPDGDAAAQAACRARIDHHRTSSEAFYSDAKPDQIFLTHGDPMSNEATRDLDPDGGNSALGSTIFHETMHSADHAGGHHHNDPDFADEVYGCQALCSSGGSGVLTREGCQACIRGYPPDARGRDIPTVAEGRNPNPSQKLLDDCGQFAPEAVLRPLKNAESLQTLVTRCYAETARSFHSDRVDSTTPSCERLQGTPEYLRICAAHSPPLYVGVISNGCEAAIAVEAAHQVRDALRNDRDGTGLRQFTHNIFPSVSGGRIRFSTLDSGVNSLRDSQGHSLDNARQFLPMAIMIDGVCKAVDTSKSPAEVDQQLRDLRQYYSADSRAQLSVIEFEVGSRRATRVLVSPILDPAGYPPARGADALAAQARDFGDYCRRFSALRSQYLNSSFTFSTGD
jgi:hypothetical protein